MNGGLSQFARVLECAHHPESRQTPPGVCGMTATTPDGRTWSIITEIEDDSDGFQYPESFAVAEDNGERRHLDWSRFQHYTLEHFKAFVAADFPPRPGLAPWFPSRIETLPQYEGIEA